MNKIAHHTKQAWNIIGFMVVVFILFSINIPSNHGLFNQLMNEQESGTTQSDMHNEFHPNLAAIRDPIRIDTDSQFIPENGVVGGDGSPGTPYLISDWVIDAVGAHGIEIRNTNAHLIIQNCSVKASMMYNGIVVYNAHNVKIINVSVSESDFGILLMSATNSSVWNSSSSHNRYDGIKLSSTFNNTICNNTVVENGWNGFDLASSHNNTLTLNNASFNIDYGFYAYNSNYSKLFNNTFVNNTQNCGIRLNKCNSSIIVNNTSAFNHVSGLDFTESYWNVVYRNNFYENIAYEVHSWLGSANNVWYFDETGNYYGDYLEQHSKATNDGRIWSIPYLIDGTSADYDNYPLVNPIGYVIPPDDDGNETPGGSSGTPTPNSSDNEEDADREALISGYSLSFLFISFLSFIVLLKKRKSMS